MAERRAAIVRSELAVAGHDGVVRVINTAERLPAAAPQQLQLCPEWPLQHRGAR
jgi:hypothetical protein